MDLSAELIATARHCEAADGLGVRYHVADVADLATWWDGVAFDGAICEMAMMDIDRLDATVGAVAAMVRPGGWFVISMVHPCFPGNDAGLSSCPPDRSYSDEGWWTSRAHNPDGVRIRVGSSHRTLSTYLNTLIAAGFSMIASSSRPRPSPGFSCSVAGASPTTTRRLIAANSPRAGSQRPSSNCRMAPARRERNCSGRSRLT